MLAKLNENAPFGGIEGGMLAINEGLQLFGLSMDPMDEEAMQKLRSSAISEDPFARDIEIGKQLENRKWKPGKSICVILRKSPQFTKREGESLNLQGWVANLRQCLHEIAFY